MTNYPDIVLIFVLILIIIIQAVERFFYAQQMNDQIRLLISRLTSLSLSKNINDYTYAVKAETEDKPKATAGADNIDLDTASEKEFDSFIETMNK